MSKTIKDLQITLARVNRLREGLIRTNFERLYLDLARPAPYSPLGKNGNGYRLATTNGATWGSRARRNIPTMLRELEAIEEVLLELRRLRDEP